MDHDIRTVFQPSQTITVGDVEFADLLGQGLIYVDWRDLYVTFRNFPTDGVETDLATEPSVRVQGPSPSTADVIAQTTTGVIHVGRGRYLFRWSQIDPIPTPGDYLVTWAGVDPDLAAVSATETVTVS